MKYTLAFASIALLGAQACSISQAKPVEQMPAMPPAAEEKGENLMLTTYIGFEFEGAELAEKFSALTNE